MEYPGFFDQVPAITLYDPLSELLGAAQGGRMDFHYRDAVRLAGHSCPTVAGAWLMARQGLAALYPATLPVRGEVRVELRAAQAAGTTGVVGAVLGLITGAAGEGGFAGLGGRYSRRGLLAYGVTLPAQLRLTRLDNGAAVLLDYHPERVPPAPEQAELMPRVLAGTATPEERARFAQLWQARVRAILLDHAEDPALLTLRRLD